MAFSFFGSLFGGKKPTPPADAVRVSMRTNPDGGKVVTTEFALRGAGRPVRDDVVAAYDEALGALGGEVLHAMDPSRLLSYMDGGPPVWSIGIVTVPGPRPYTLLLTYGFSHELSPEPFRTALHHEYSLALPAGVPISPWADAFLRHQCRYILSQGTDINVDDLVPFRGVPMTRIAFQPQHHAAMPDSSLIAELCVPDPVLGAIETLAGPVEVRRLVGLDEKELARAESWSPRHFGEELAIADPLLLSGIERPSYMDDPTFSARVNERAAREGRLQR